MEKCFVNFSNHPSHLWNKAQLESAHEYGQIVDIPFPMVSPKATNAEIKSLADAFVERIMQLNPIVVLCQGEFTLCYQVIQQLKNLGIVVVAATSERNVKVNNNTKIVTFDFVKYREY